VDHQKNQTALTREQGFTISYNGNKHPIQTTKGWDMCVKWCDGTTSWIPLKDIKHANPLKLADYAMANKIHDEPAFAWWVPNVLRWKNCIVSKLKSKYWKTSHKFGIEIPKSVEHTLQIDCDTA